jgi:Ni,Fe-hydrogenase III small subunit
LNWQRKLRGESALLVHLARCVESETRRLPDRTQAIREADAGSCDGVRYRDPGPTSPVYDAERFGSQFVTLPRHAGLLLVGGAVTHYREVSLSKIYEASVKNVIPPGFNPCN